MAEKGWKAYRSAVIAEIPRLDGDSEELEHRARLLWLRDHAQKQRAQAQWFDDNLLTAIISMVTPYALSTRLRPDQVASLWDSCSDMASVVSKLRAIGLD